MQMTQCIIYIEGTLFRLWYPGGPTVGLLKGTLRGVVRIFFCMGDNQNYVLRIAFWIFRKKWNKLFFGKVWLFHEVRSSNGCHQLDNKWGFCSVYEFVCSVQQIKGLILHPGGGGGFVTRRWASVGRFSP